MSRSTYTKPRLSIDEQIQLLERQGLQIENSEKLRHLLTVVGYYRFSGYLHPFKLPHQDNTIRSFKVGTSFEFIWGLYQFDRELRLLVADAIEKIEVAFRSSISEVTSEAFNLFWYMDKKFYHNQSQYINLTKKIDTLLRKPEEVFVQHYLKKYHYPSYPPIWMIIETLSFGTCSKLFTNIQSISVRNRISDVFNQHTTIIESWIRVLVWIRNIGAHHARLWNRWLVESPIISKKDPARVHILNNNRKFIAIAYIIFNLLKEIEPESTWKQKLFNLFEKYEDYPGVAMGFDKNWRNDLFWKL